MRTLYEYHYTNGKEIAVLEVFASSKEEAADRIRRNFHGHEGLVTPEQITLSPEWNG